MLRGARQLADARGQTLGQALSDLARASLAHAGESATRNGVMLLPLGERRGGATLDEVNRLRDDE